MRLSVGALLSLAGLLALELLRADPALAENVAAFTGATIELLPQPPPGPGGTPPIPLDLDPNAAPTDATTFSIPPGSIAQITVTGTTAAAGAPVAHVYDDDKDEFLRGADDELDERPDPFPPPAGGAFEIRLYIDCTPPELHIEGIVSSGEQSAEIYVLDGAQRVPAPKNLPGGGTKRSWWMIDCDKETTQIVTPTGTTVNTQWGDSLVIPPGALPAPMNLRMANAYPLPGVDAVPHGYQPISEAQTLEPGGLPLLVPATLTFQYTQEEVGETADENTLAVFHYEPSLMQWLPVPGAMVDPQNDRLSVPIPAFGIYGFAALIPPPPVPALPVLGAAGVAVAVLGYAAGRLRRARSAQATRPRA